MIIGRVNAHRDAVIRIVVIDAHGLPHEFDAVVDTGFNGSLTLPRDIILALGLKWRSRSATELADGSVQQCDIYAGKIEWDGLGRGVLIESADTEPLVGMLLMYGYDLNVHVIDGGQVTLLRM